MPPTEAFFWTPGGRDWAVASVARSRKITGTAVKALKCIVSLRRGIVPVGYGRRPSKPGNLTARRWPISAPPGEKRFRQRLRIFGFEHRPVGAFRVDAG